MFLWVIARTGFILFSFLFSFFFFLFFLFPFFHFSFGAWDKCCIPRWVDRKGDGYCKDEVKLMYNCCLIKILQPASARTLRQIAWLSSCARQVLQSLLLSVCFHWRWVMLWSGTADNIKQINKRSVTQRSQHELWLQRWRSSHLLEPPESWTNGLS